MSPENAAVDGNGPAVSDSTVPDSTVPDSTVSDSTVSDSPESDSLGSGPARTIDEVLEHLDRILERSLEAPSRLGYFAALYRKVTEKVKEGIEEGFFDNGPRMERLDVVFANRYLTALGQFEAGGSPTESWQVAFDAAARWRPLILQQLLVGINAHINLDLGIAAAEIAPGDQLADLKDDFDRINEILFSLVHEVEQQVGSLSPWIAFLERIGGKLDDVIVRFGLRIARDGAWRLAERLAPLPRDQWPAPIAERDHGTAELGREIVDPGPFLRWGLLIIRMRESSDIRRIIEVLMGCSGPSLHRIEERRLARAAGR